MADAGGIAENAAEIAVVNAINNINGRNRIIAGGLGGGAGQNNMMNMRDRLFHAIYFRVAATYAELVPRKVQLAIEYLLLLKALVFFFTLVYVHTAFIKNPCSCLQEVQNWPRDGVIRVEIIPYLAEKRAIWEGIKADKQLLQSLKHTYHYDVGPQTLDNHNRLRRYEAILRKLGAPVRPVRAYSNETLYFYFEAINLLDNYEHPSAIPLKTEDDDDDEQYIVEYSLEYGHLRLSAATRKRLNIPVLTVQLDPNTNKCFGDKLSRYLLKRLLGYDDLLMASVRTIAEKEDNKGYLRNVITGEHYRFVSMWWAAWSSYPAALSVMLLFTFSVSMLLRYSHHQIFVFIVDLLQMLEYNVSARFPIAPLLTVILALVGMEAIMSEFFNDTTTAFYIILIVWIADQFDAICVHTSITKRHWLRFFYLYHFAFYAYHYRFSGQYRTLALLSSYLFIQHSMVFFFHRYELPAIMAQRHVFFITRNQLNAAAGGAAAGAGVAGAAAAGAAAEDGARARAGAAGDAAEAGQQAAVQRARVIVTRLFRQLAAQRQGQQQQQAGAAAGGGAADAAGAAEPQQQAGADNATGFGNLRRLPLVGRWLQRGPQFTTVRRVFLGQGHGPVQMMHVRVQRINVADIPGLQTRAAAAAVAASAAAAAATVAATAAAEAAQAAANAAATLTTTAAPTSSPITPTTPSEDVESNHGQGRCEAPATATATAAARTINSINDAGATEQGIEEKNTGAGAAAEASEDKQELGHELGHELGSNLGQAAVPKTLKNLNSATADIINMPDTTTTAASAAKTIATTWVKAEDENEAKAEAFGLPLAKQLANNLPSRSTQQTQPSEERPGENQSSPLLHAQSISTDQQKEQQPSTTTTTIRETSAASTATSKQSRADAKAEQKQTATQLGIEFEFELGTESKANASTMMDGRQTVDFIEGDSFTSTANYNDVDAIANHIEKESEKESEEREKQGELMKTLPHTSNQVTRAAEAAATNN
ncbi:membralin isoform X1 [Drosophila albomicans]|uniref:Membralin isoform X1 n=1 Tax=Drosophila albomicans TaxID=7291 RepID=A0A6P8Y9Q8_DROAB|nr:membralin isoform X1 [Drosophila albomicans]